MTSAVRKRNRASPLLERAFKVTQGRVGMSEVFGNLDTGSVDRRPGNGRSWTAGNAILLVTSCTGRQARHRHVCQYLKFQWKLEFVYSSIGLIIRLRSHQPGEEQRAYSVASVFWGSVATQVRWGGTLWMLLEYQDIMCQKDRFETLQKKKPSGHFLRRTVYLYICVFLCSLSSYAKKSC